MGEPLVVPPILIPEKFEVLSKPKPIKIIYGGRNSAKTESAGRQTMIDIYASEEPFRVVGARMFYNSIEDSMYGMLQEFNRVYKFGFDDSANKIRNHRNGSSIHFMGLARNIENIKSKFKPNRLIIDEAEGLTQNAIDYIEPTFRDEDSEIWIFFNPKDFNDPVWQHYVAPYINHIERDGFFEDEDIYVTKVNYTDNPFISDMALRRMNKMKQQHPKKYLHVYEGEPNGSFEDAIIQPEWFDAAVDAHIKLKFEGLGEVAGSLDIADDGADSKAYLERKGVVVHKLVEWEDGDLHGCIAKGLGLAGKGKVDNFIYDYVGMGRAVNVYLKSNRSIKFDFKIEGFDGGSSVDNPDVIYDDVDALEDKKKRINKDVFRNKRAQYYIGLADRFYRTWLAVEKGQYIDPITLISISSDIENLQKLRSELIKIPMKKSMGSDLLQIMSKVEMKRKGMASPNLADALSMIFATSPREREYVPEQRAPINYR